MSDMKDSGYDWLGLIPKEWNLLRGKYVFKQRNSKGNKINLQLVSPTQNYGVIPQSLYEQLSGMSPVKLNEKTDFMMMKTIHSGDFCISLRSFQGGFEYSAYEGVLSPAYQVFYPKKEIADGYYRYLFKSNVFIDKINSYTMSLRDGKNIAFSDFGNTYIPYLDIEEQQRIADFLDEKCGEIDGIVAKIQQEMETLKQYKQSIISEAVTKGIRPNVPMKDSGIDYIGKIPESWRFPKITHILDYLHNYPIGDGDHGTIKADAYSDSGIPFIRVQNLGYSPELKLDNVVYITEEQNKNIKNSTLHPGDILFAKTGATIGKVGIMPDYLPKANTTSHVGKITVNKKTEPKYICYFLSSNIGYKQLWDIAALKSTRPELSIDEIKTIRVLYPPLEEQREIAAYLDQKCAAIDGIISSKEEQLQTLSSYKKSLIYEYVTGKKRVPKE